MAQGDKSERTDNSTNKLYSIMPSVDFSKIILPAIMQDLTGNSEAMMPLCPIDYNE